MKKIRKVRFNEVGISPSRKKKPIVSKKAMFKRKQTMRQTRKRGKNSKLMGRSKTMLTHINMANFAKKFRQILKKKNFRDMNKFERIMLYRNMKILMKPKIKYKLKLDKMKQIII